MPRYAIAVMAKAPQPGRAKTRLSPPLTASEAAALSAAFLRDITENITLAASENTIHGYIAYAPGNTEHLFENHIAETTKFVLADGNIEVPPDVDGFGKCLLHAASSLLAQQYEAICLVNSDSPTLPTQLLAEAISILAQPGDRAVLGLAEDGGYYLIGIKALHKHLFSQIDWSTEKVAAQTMQRAEEIGLELALLPAWYDVDDVSSLQRLCKQLSTTPDKAERLQPYGAPATAECLIEIGLLPDLMRELKGA